MKKQFKCSLWMSILLGVGVTVGILLILLCILSGVSTGMGLSDTLYGILLTVAVAVSWFLGAFFVGKTRRQKGLMWGAIHAGCLFVLLLIFSVIIKGNEASILSLKSLLYLLPGGLVSAFGGILGVHFALKRR